MKKIVIVAMVAVLGLTACGKRGAPNPPEGVESTYPKSYPKPETLPRQQ
ncbi:MAG: hypothetical protein NXI16_00160 [Alphaproteobacteria bacterium]|nr:hypothetical protein [Alphaproteobacteria bacterium]